MTKDDRQAVEDWRRRAEVLWAVSKLLDDLAVRFRNAAHACDRQAAACEEKLSPVSGQTENMG